MPRTKTLSKFQAKLATELKEYSLTMACMVVGVTFLNLIIAAYVRNSGLPFVSNYRPIGFTFDYFSSIAILIVVSWLVYEFKIYVRAAIGTILMLSGLYANFLEKMTWGSVADYMSIYELSINLADVQIILGLLFLNWKLWTSQETNENLFESQS